MLYYLLLNNNMTMQELFLVLVFTVFVYFFSLSLHEFAHGFAAYKMGDDTAKQMGRLTLNPFRHIDPIGMISFMLVGIGWAKPMPVNPVKFKKFRTGMRWVSVAGVLANFLLGLISAIIYGLLVHFVGFDVANIEYLYLLLQYFMLVNSFLVLYNLLPIYPLDGFNFMTTLFKGQNKFLSYCFKNGFKILFGILIGSVIIELFTGFDILGWYLSLIYNYIFVPIVRLGV